MLLERLIFLYFLQNRGWLNRDRRYLLSAFQQYTTKPEQYSYYHEFLDKLFWTLATAPGSAARLSGIPFLNGGLFDDDEFLQTPNRRTNPPLKVRNKTMQYVFGELLEAFNFTVTEDTPLNQEVAVDPEMLGKVFESIVLHAEDADPDAMAPDKRKDTGSYYTPRIVVHFICREVLYQYLLWHLAGDDWGPRLKGLLYFEHTDGFDEEEKELLKRTITPDQARTVLELVKPLKCCDPAVGSGAFPVGLMQELVNLRRLLETVLNGYRDPVVSHGSTWLHDTKAHIVENCLFGVDIQQQAIEICRLRLWLSLVVDYDLGLDPFSAEQRQFMEAIDRMSQLPNLEMNFRRGDSLHDHICGVPVVILPERSMRHFEDFKKIAKLGKDLHQAKKSDRKKRLRLAILRCRLELSHKLVQEEVVRIESDDSALDGLFGFEESQTNKRERNKRELTNLKRALAQIEKDTHNLDKLERREADNEFYAKLRKLEGADFDSPFNFAWHIDFPNVFAVDDSGFDVVVGNPPFVTARNPNKRELWRKRWPRVCTGTYQLVCPFMELGFSLLAPRGQLGVIVSNAFGTREFGQPLVEEFLPGVTLQKIVDCSGLAFPGHGTPTWLVFGNALSPDATRPVRTSVILPGGGDLRTAPEDSPLWRTLADHHDQPGFSDNRIAVSDWPRLELFKWPLNLDYDAYQLRRLIENNNTGKIGNHIEGTIGRVCFTGADDIYFVPEGQCRRLGIETQAMARFVVGDLLRNWMHSEVHCICPYDLDGKRLPESKVSGLLRYLHPWSEFLRARLSYEQTQEERGLAWWEFSIVFPERIRGGLAISITEIATHNHACVIQKPFLANRANPIVQLKTGASHQEFHLLAATLCSSTALFWMKQVCYNKGAGKDEERDRFEFAGGKIQQLPVALSIEEALSGKPNALATRLIELAQACDQRAQQSSALALKKLFERPGEAYGSWNSLLPSYLSPNPAHVRSFEVENDLRSAQENMRRVRDRVKAEMVALQEEMDWLTYALYGLLPSEKLSCCVSHDSFRAVVPPAPIEQAQRPFRLWELAGGDYQKAQQLIPDDWMPEQRQTWEARLAEIRDNPHIRRIEQPVYKRRWDEQWKVGSTWRSGEIAYAAEFLDAFEWWLKEKAEWWLEHKKNDRPSDLSEWAQALWKDSRIQASWPVAAEQYAFLSHEKAREKAEKGGDPTPAPPKPASDFKGFSRRFKQLIDEETVPVGFPFGTDYERLAKSLQKPIPAQLKEVRGKLNVPRERFHSTSAGLYSWAGLQFIKR